MAGIPPAVLFTVLPYWFNGDYGAAASAGIFSSIGADSRAPSIARSTRTVAVLTASSTTLSATVHRTAFSLARSPLTSTASKYLSSIDGIARNAGSSSTSDHLSIYAEATQAASAGTHASDSSSQAEGANETWPLTLAVMLLVALGAYILLVSPILAKYLASGRWRSRSYFLRSSPSPMPTDPGRIPYPRRAGSGSRFIALARGAYNRSLLVSITVIRLTLGQCLVLFIYTGCVVLATFTQSGDLGKDAIRSGRIA